MYASWADNLGPDDRNDVGDIYAYDIATQSQTLISHTISGDQPDGDSSYPSVGFDGNHIAYSSVARNISPRDRNGESDVFSYDVATGETLLRSRTKLGAAADGVSDLPSISDDGSVVVYESTADDLVTGATNHTKRIYASLVS